MNRSRRKVDPPPALTASSLEQQAAKHKPNRLSRSSRQSQQTAEERDSPRSQKSEFKTPTRIPRSRVSGGFSAESPHNDSDIQQDIIWDATSPSPQRLGKRGKKHPAAGFVDISEIVNRIAPKHGRPKAAEPTLQQWIGDSANIPCTPDVQLPKPKKKSPRPNGVDDLLKLAKQFDFNMFRQDEEEEAEDLHQQSQELLSEEILDFENGDLNDVSPSLPGNRQPAAMVTAAADTDLDQHMEDDLDFLFDGPTQHISGDLSQFSSAFPSQVKHAPAESSKEASGKPRPHVPTVGVAMTHAKGASANDEFEDDWENDDFLDDSLVLEVTQNPQNFSAPKHCSTQKPASEMKHRPLHVPAGGGVRLSQSAASKAEKENVRRTFKLESNPKFSVERIPTNTNLKCFSDQSWKTEGKDSQQSRFSSVETGNKHTWQTYSQFHQRTSAATVKHSTSSSTASNTAATKTTQNLTNGSSPSEAPAVSDADFLDDDLDYFFSSDPVWDDPADDDLLCEMCDDLENQIQRAENVSTKQTHQRPVLQPSNRNQQTPNQQPASGRGGAFVQPLSQKQSALTCGSGRPAGSFASGVPAGARVDTAKDSIRFTQSKSASGTTNSSTCLQASSRVQSAAAAPPPPPPPPQGNSGKHQFTFKKPNNPVSTVTNTAAFGKCSAAEIELKKQQAMERRRQRLQAVQNLQAPT
ncbi:ewing's tumor-associated antigen 1 [Thunnus thynnus]|uniref:ewing's tumor-associated antigen 1 n=1 Tax=Thunnus thynnus TaxID=8237 RepID=UPI0035298D12